MKIRNRLFILIMAAVIASAQWVPAFAVSQDSTVKITDGDVKVTASEESAESEGTFRTTIRKEVKAEAAIVIDAETGEILYGKDAYSKREPASTTKIVTCLVALDKLELDQEIKVKTKAVEMGNIIGVKKGEKFTAEQLMYALMVHSANDAAVALAEEIAGSEDEFAKLMTQKAKQLGANSTNFQNANGLNWAWHDQHYTTAYDLAIITKEAMKNKDFRKMVSAAEYTIPKTNKSAERHLYSSNKFLWTDEIYKEVLKEARKDSPEEKIYRPEYEGVIGVKTGLTSTAGACLVGAKDVNGRELIAVVLDSGDDQRWKDMMAMWDYCIDEFYLTYPQMKAGSEVAKIRVKRGEVRKVQAVAAEEIAATITKEEDYSNVDTEIVKYDLKAPVKKGDVVGKVKVLYDGKVINQKLLIAAETIEKGGFLSIFGIPDWLAPFVYITVILLLLIILIKSKLKQMRREKARRKREERRRRDNV